MDDAFTRKTEQVIGQALVTKVTGIMIGLLDSVEDKTLLRGLLLGQVKTLKAASFNPQQVLPKILNQKLNLAMAMSLLQGFEKSCCGPLVKKLHTPEMLARQLELSQHDCCIGVPIALKRKHGVHAFTSSADHHDTCYKGCRIVECRHLCKLGLPAYHVLVRPNEGLSVAPSKMHS
eukprot:338502-Amphidinium_carterae.1